MHFGHARRVVSGLTHPGVAHADIFDCISYDVPSLVLCFCEGMGGVG